MGDAVSSGEEWRDWAAIAEKFCEMGERIMIILPAIDIKDGRCVRLYQGDYAQVTTYADDPVPVAQGFQAAGARWLHVVDLDGADGLTRFLLGAALVYEQKFTEEALRCFERTHDEYPLAHLLAARVLIEWNNLETARAEIRTYLSGKDQSERLIATKVA